MGNINTEFSLSKLGLHSERVHEFLEGKDVVPVTFEVSVTNKCNYSCPWCSEDVFRSIHPTAEIEFFSLMDMIRSMEECGVRSITFEGGGEPTVYPEFQDVILRPQVTMDFGLITNGSRLSKFPAEMYQRLKYVRVSFDSYNEASYHKVHGVHKFRQVLDSMAYVAKIPNRGVLGMSYIVSEDTVKGMQEAARLAQEVGADYIQFKPLLGSGWAFSYTEGIEVALEPIRTLQRTLEASSTTSFRVFLSRFAKDEIGLPVGKREYKFCRAHRFVGAVAPTGDVFLCCNLKHKYPGPRFSFGNVHKESFKDIWFGKKRRELLDWVESDTKFLEEVCMYCRMNDFNQFLENTIDNGFYNPLWRFI